MIVEAPIQSPPFVKGQPFLGVLNQFRKNPPEFLLSVARRHGDLAHMRLGPQETYVVSNPDWIKDVLVTNQSNFMKSRVLQRAKVLLGEGLLTSEAEFHTRQRRLVQPAFHRDRLIGYGAAMVDCAVQCRDRWHSGETLDMSREMARLTLAVVARTLFSADVSSDADEIGTALTAVLGLFEWVQLPFSEWLEKLPLPAVRRFERARAVLDKIIYGIIADRRKSGHDAGDLLSMLLFAQDEGSGMTDKQVRDEALTLFLAGHETTANALAWTWYLLSQNPEAERNFTPKSIAHSRDACPPSRTFRSLSTWKWSSRNPCASTRPRGPSDAATWSPSDRGYPIPARSIILMSPYVVHRDPRWFPNPESSIPTAGCPKPSQRAQNSPISPSAAARGSALASASRGWKASCCWPLSPSAGD